MSQARVRPNYSKELAAFRSIVRPFLYPGGTLAEHRSLESCSPGVGMCQSAPELTAEGRRRQRAFAETFNCGQGARSRESRPPHFITTDEQKYYQADARRTTASLREEFLALLHQLPDHIDATDLCTSFEEAKNKDDVLECLLGLRRLASAAMELTSGEPED